MVKVLDLSDEDHTERESEILKIIKEAVGEERVFLGQPGSHIHISENSQDQRIIGSPPITMDTGINTFYVHSADYLSEAISLAREIEEAEIYGKEESTVRKKYEEY